MGLYDTTISSEDYEEMKGYNFTPFNPSFSIILSKFL